MHSNGKKYQMLYDTAAAGVARRKQKKNNKKASFCTQSPGFVTISSA